MVSAGEIMEGTCVMPPNEIPDPGRGGSQIPTPQPVYFAGVRTDYYVTSDHVDNYIQAIVSIPPEMDVGVAINRNGHEPPPFEAFQNTYSQIYPTWRFMQFQLGSYPDQSPGTLYGWCCILSNPATIQDSKFRVHISEGTL